MGAKVMFDVELAICRGAKAMNDVELTTWRWFDDSCLLLSIALSVKHARDVSP